MANSGTHIEEIQELRRQITLIHRILDVLRKTLGLQTKLEKLQWEKIAREIARKHSIDEDLFVAVLYCESGMDPKAVNRNENRTTDYGICQFNDYWYKDIISPDTALNNPKAALYIMAKMWQDGRQSDWICYRNKMYIPWLNP